MAKQIEFTYEGVNYTLEYTRESIRKAEKNGLIISQIGDKPMTMLPLLFHGAFVAHHPKMREEDSERIWDSLTNKKDLIERLSEMYAESINAMADDPEESAGNVTWGANW